MKRWLLAVLILLPLHLFAQVNTVYIAQTAGTFSGGSACNGKTAQAYTFFNNATNWTSGTPAGNQIGPGTLVYICGTITGSGTNGTNVLTLQGSGNSSNCTPPTNGVPGSCVYIKWDTNAIVEEPFCGKNGSACVYANGKSYWVLDGGTNGIISNYSNGTSGLSGCPGVNQTGGATCSNQQQSTSLEADCGTNCEVKNFKSLDSYYRLSSSDAAPAPFGNEACLFLQGSSANTNLYIHDNTIHDGRWCVTLEFVSGSNFQFYNNEIYNAGHAIAPIINANSTFDGAYFYNNHTHDFTAWCCNGAFHNNSMHVFQAGANTTGTFTHFFVYNNEFDGPEPGMTSQVYLEPNGNINSIGTGWIFNNVFSGAGTEGGGNGLYGMFAGGTSLFVANNTGICDAANQASSTQIGMGSDQPIKGVTWQNNLITSCSEPWYMRTTVTFNAGSPDYNLYAVISSGLQCNGSFFTTMPGWRTCTGGETHSNIFATTPLPACNSITDCSNVRPQAGSTAIGFATNLNTTCNGQPVPGLGALCYDKPQSIGPGSGSTVGNARPTSTAWDAGAYQFAAPIALVSPSSLTFSGQIVGTNSASQPVTLQNTGNATMTIASIATSGDFSQANTCSSTLAVNASCTINVTFSPTAVGTRSGTLSFTDNAGGSPQTVSLTGTGISPVQTSIQGGTSINGGITIQ